MVWIARQEQIEAFEVDRDPCVAFLMDDESLPDALEPIMYRFLQRTVEAIKRELNQVLQLPEKQFISSFEDAAVFEKRDNELSQALKRRRLPRQQKLVADLNLLLGNTEDAASYLLACVGELMKSEDWMWAGAALEARSAITSDSQYISQAVAIYQKQGQW